MKSLLQYTLCSFLALSSACCVLADDDASAEQGNKRRTPPNYSKRRYYTKQIDIFDSNAGDKIKVPEEEAPGHAEGLDMTRQSTAAKDMTSRAPAPRPPAKARNPQAEDSNNWLLNALMEKDDEVADPLDFNAADESDSSWGWLARHANMTRQQQGQEEVEEDDLDAYFEEEETRVLKRVLNRSAGGANAGSLFTANESQKAEEIFRDHDEEERRRYEIFKRLDDKGEDGQERKDIESNENPRYASIAETDLDAGIGDKYSWVEDQTQETARDYSQEISLARQGNRRMVSRSEKYASRSRRIEIANTQPGYDTGLNEREQFKSAFDGGMSSKLRSPFKSTYQSSSSSSYNSNSGGDREFARSASSYSPQRSGSDDYSSSYAPIGGGKPLGGRDKLESNIKKLPYSVNQWD